MGKIVATAEHLEWSARAPCKRKVGWERVCAYRKTKTEEKGREREREREEYRAGDRSTEINIEGSLAAGPRG